MMKRVFLDTNIMLDLVMHREHFESALAITKGAYEGRFDIFASTLSFANIAYVLRKEPQDKVCQVLDMLAEDINMLPLTPEDIRNTISHPVRDLEDMMQYQCAKAAGCDAIVTNNKKDFHQFCDLPFLTSEEFLLQFDDQE